MSYQAPTMVSTEGHQLGTKKEGKEEVEAGEYLEKAHIAPEVFALRPDYRALLMIVSGIPQGPSDDMSEILLREAEASAREQLTRRPVTELPHITAWREAYKSFGAKPTKFRNSLEALTRRVRTDTAVGSESAAAAAASAAVRGGGGGGLPRVNRLTDIYNAISVKHQIPLGGEDLDRYAGPPRLIRASGTEKFETTAGGEAVIEHPDAGEVVWCDDEGVTCRRWNWRQGPRTALTEHTTRALFILDVLDPMTDEAIDAAADELVSALQRLGGDDVKVVRRMMKKKMTTTMTT